MGKHLGGGGSTVIFGTLAGAGGAALTGGNVWQGAATGAIVAGLNHVAHNQSNGEDPPGTPKSFYKRKIAEAHEFEQLVTKNPRNAARFLFNSIETTGETIEIGALVLAPFTEGVSLSFYPIGFEIASTGVIGNTLVDIYDEKYGAAIWRLGKHYATFGLGNVLHKIAGQSE